MSRLVAPLWLECLFRTSLHAFKTEDALGAIPALPRIIEHIDIHRADFPASVAGDALRVVAGDPYEREIAHGLQEHCDRADVFAEGTVVL